MTLDTAVLDSFRNPAWRTEKRKKARTAKQAKRLSFSSQPMDYKVLAIHQLRVNVASLAAESRIIRKEEKRCGIQYESVLRDHRVRAVREEARYTYLALAFVRGSSYAETENKAKVPVDISRLGKKVIKNLYVSDVTKKLCDWGAGV